MTLLLDIEHVHVWKDFTEPIDSLNVSDAK